MMVGGMARNLYTTKNARPYLEVEKGFPYPCQPPGLAVFFLGGSMKRLFLLLYKQWLELQITHKWNRKLSLKLDRVIDRLGV